MHAAVDLFAENRDVHVLVLSIINFIIKSVLGIRYLGLLRLLIILIEESGTSCPLELGV